MDNATATATITSFRCSSSPQLLLLAGTEFRELRKLLVASSAGGGVGGVGVVVGGQQIGFQLPSNIAESIGSWFGASSSST